MVVTHLALGGRGWMIFRYSSRLEGFGRSRGTQLSLSRAGVTQRSHSSSLARSQLELFTGGTLAMVGLGFDKKLGQLHEIASGKNKINYCCIDVGNDNRRHAMDYSDKAVRVGDSVNVDFGIDNVSSRYASQTRLSSPALSEASSCTLKESTPESLSLATPAKKRAREEDEVIMTNREIFNAAKRHTGSPVTAFDRSYVSHRPVQTRNIPQVAALNQRNPLHSLRAHQSKTWANPLRQASPQMHVPQPDIIELIDEEGDTPAFQVPPGAIVWDVEDPEGESELEKEILDIEPQIAAKDKFQHPALSTRNPEITLPNVEKKSLEWNSLLLRPGKTVQLTNGTFLKIKTIVENLESDEVSIRGWKLVRTSHFDLSGMAGRKRNEVAFVHELDKDDKQDVWEQSVHTIRPDEIVKIRRLICTNSPFPKYRYEKEHIPLEIASKSKKEILKHIEDDMVLVARWVFMARYSNAEARVRKGARVDRPRDSGELRLLKKEECMEDYFVDPDILRKQWRGETILGGSGNRNNGGDSSNRSSKYTFGDGYCGAGGMTAGAAAASLIVKWGFDFNEHAGLTWQENFPSAKFHHNSVHEFEALPDPGHDLWVDILHLSPPCQVFSPIHTREGRNDEMNYASLFGVKAAIEKARPRIVTLEQTFGIMHPKHKLAFYGLIGCFTELGYSVSWQVVNFQGYGLPTRRTRLIILASCPGESLPHMPEYTYHEPHLSSASKKPYKTPHQALSAIPPDAPNHDPQNPQLTKGSYIPWDSSVICGTVMTSGANGLGLPDGSRGMTNRELASLQGFPLRHVFHGQEIRRQVGNAVPPVFGKRLLASVRRQLERRDGWVRKEVIVLSSGEE